MFKDILNNTTFIYYLIYFFLVPVFTSRAENILYSILLQDYNHFTRPVEKGNSTVVVGVGLLLHQIIDVDEKNQQIELHAQLNITWVDKRLSWNYNNYDGIKKLRFPKNVLWTPDLLLYNSVAEEFDTSYPVNILVNYDGTIIWQPPAILKFSCTMNIVFFPFDSQYCEMKFGSWTYDGSKVELTTYPEIFDISKLIENTEWSLIDKYAIQNIQYYKCCPEPYYDVVFKFTLKRKTIYYGINLIIPCLIITLMTLIGFIFPSEAGEKTSLQISIMLSICIFQNYVSDMSPPSSDSVPFLGMFFIYCLLYLSGSIVATTITLAVHNRSSKSHYLSYMIIKIFSKWLPYFCLLKRPRTRFCDMKDDGEIIKEKMEKIECFQIMESIKKYSNGNDSDKEILSQVLILEKILADIKEYKKIFDENHEDHLVEKDYEFMGIVIDRACLVISSIFIVVSTITFFISVM
uniref:Acetylcholine receptor subunit alpha-type acr-16 n=1 Tax=Strongyloides venezuelensis TaxID=75913 RepID=A0A0K0FBH0_STRVS